MQPLWSGDASYSVSEQTQAAVLQLCLFSLVHRPNVLPSHFWELPVPKCRNSPGVPAARCAEALLSRLPRVIAT